MPTAALLTYSEHEVWLAPSDRFMLLAPTPVKVFSVGMPVLLASHKFGRWLEATITTLDNHDRTGALLEHTPNELHFRFVEAQNLRTRALGDATFVDPYCVLQIGSWCRHATRVKRRTLNPVWNELAVFALAERDLMGGGTASSSASANTSMSMLRSGSASGSMGSSSGSGGPSANAPSIRASATTALPPLRVSVFNHDQFALHECLGEVEIDLHDFRDGRKHRLLIPLSQKRHVWTLEAIQSVMRKQALGGIEYPMLGWPHVLVELQWIDTRLPTKVTVRVHGPRPTDLVLSRKFCETNLCYGIDPEQIGVGRLHAAD